MTSQKTPRAQLLPAPISDREIEQLVQAINGYTRLAGVELALRIGSLIVDRFYAGDLKALRARGAKDASFRKLACHPQLEMSASSLQRCVAVYELCARLGVSTWKHLGVSHLRAVMALPDPAQKQLLLAAEEGGWTVQQLQDQVQAQRNQAENRGRPPLPPLVKTLNKLTRQLEGAAVDASDLDALSKLDPDEALHLYQAAAEVRAWCEQVEAHFRQHFVGLDGH